MLEKLPDGVYVLDLRSKPILDIITPVGGAVIDLPDGRTAVISIAPDSVQLLDMFGGEK